MGERERRNISRHHHLTMNERTVANMMNSQKIKNVIAGDLEIVLQKYKAPIGIYIGAEAIGSDLSKDNLLQRTQQAIAKLPLHATEIIMTSMMVYSVLECPSCDLPEFIMKVAGVYEKKINPTARC